MKSSPVSLLILQKIESTEQGARKKGHFQIDIAIRKRIVYYETCIKNAPLGEILLLTCIFLNSQAPL